MSYFIDPIVFTGLNTAWPTSDIPVIVVSNPFFYAKFCCLPDFKVSKVLIGLKTASPIFAASVKAVSNGFVCVNLTSLPSLSYLFDPIV